MYDSSISSLILENCFDFFLNDQLMSSLWMAQDSIVVLKVR